MFTAAAADAAWRVHYVASGRASSRIARDESKGRHVGSACIPDVRTPGYSAMPRRGHVAPLNSMFITLPFIRAIIYII